MVDDAEGEVRGHRSVCLHPSLKDSIPGSFHLSYLSFETRSLCSLGWPGTICVLRRVFNIGSTSMSAGNTGFYFTVCIVFYRMLL